MLAHINKLCVCSGPYCPAVKEAVVWHVNCVMNSSITRHPSYGVKAQHCRIISHIENSSEEIMVPGCDRTFLHNTPTKPTW